MIAANDNWRLAANATEITPLPNAPKHDSEAAILTMLAPGCYTVHMSGVGGGKGIGIIALGRP